MRVLDLSGVGVKDITPLANLTALESLLLDRNAIVDITPLSGLKNLKNLWLAENPILDFSPLAQLPGVELDIEIDLSQIGPKPKIPLMSMVMAWSTFWIWSLSPKLSAFDVIEVPDPNLRKAIRERLKIHRSRRSI